MSFRITTGMMMNDYKYNLTKSTARMDSARNKVLSERKYDSYAEDPASAAHEWRIRRAITRNAGYITSNTEAYARINTAWTTLESIDDNLLNGAGGAFESIKRADNDPTGGARTALGKVLDNLAQSIVYSLNGAMYGDHFLFSGNDEMNAPFSWDGNNLLYRGIPVDSGWAKSVPTVPDWAKDTDELKNLIPLETPTFGELEAKYPDPDALSATDKEQYYYDLAWTAYYRGGSDSHSIGPGDDPTRMPDWVSEYKAALEAAAGTDEEVNIDDYYLQSGASALDQGWKALLDDAIADATDGEGELDIDQVIGEIDRIAGKFEKKPDWGKSELPKNIPDIEDVDTNWEKAWAMYYQSIEDSEVYGGTGEPALEPPGELIKPTWKLEDPSTWPGYSTTVPRTYEDIVQDAWMDYARDQENVRLLDAMSAEVKNMDLGMGLKEDGNGDLLQSTVFDRAVPGINIIGYGVDEDGDPKNLVSIMKRLATLYSKCGDDGTFYKVDKDGNYILNDNNERIVDQETTDEVYRLLDKFGAAHEAFNQAYSDVDTRGEYLQSNAERLVSQNVTLQEQLYDVSQIDPALAIEEFSYTYYCYSAALKIGTQLLSQSLIDYMR